MKKISISSLEPAIVSAIELAKIIKSERIKNTELKQRRINSTFFTIKDNSIIDKIEYDFIQPETPIYSGLLRCKHYGVDTIVTVEEGFTFINSDNKEGTSLLTTEQIMTGGLGDSKNQKKEALAFSVTNFVTETMVVYFYPYKIDKLDNVVIWEDSGFVQVTGLTDNAGRKLTDMDSQLAIQMVSSDDIIDSLVSEEDSVYQTIEIIKFIKASDTDSFYDFCVATEDSLIDSNSDQFLISFEKALGAELQCL